MEETATLDDKILRQLLICRSEGRLWAPTSRTSTRGMRSKVRKDVLVEPVRGLFEEKELWDKTDARLRTLAVLRTLQDLHPGWVFGDASAAIAYDLDVSWSSLQPVVVTMSRRSPVRPWPGIRRHCVDDDETCMIGGLQVTSPSRTVIDCARHLEPTEGLVIADSALHARLVGRSELADQIDQMQRCHGMRRACSVIDFADERSESGGESLARLVIARLGFAAPDLQHEVVDPLDGMHLYRADMAWTCSDGSVVLGELDGRQKYVDPAMTNGKSVVAVMAEERLRESRISATGARIMRFSYDDVMDDERMYRLLTVFGVPRERKGRTYPH